MYHKNRLTIRNVDPKCCDYWQHKSTPLTGCTSSTIEALTSTENVGGQLVMFQPAGWRNVIKFNGSDNEHATMF